MIKTINQGKVRNISYPVLKVYGGNVFSMSIILGFRDKDLNIMHPAKIQPQCFLTVAKRHDMNTEVTMLLNINDVHTFFNEVERMATMPVMQTWSGVISEPNPNISEEEKLEYKEKMDEYKETKNPDLKEELRGMKKPNITKKIVRSVNISSSDEYHKVSSEMVELNVKKLTKGIPFIDTHTQTFKKYTDSSKNKDTNAGSSKTLTLKIEVNDRTTNETPTFEQKGKSHMYFGEIGRHFNLKVMEKKNGRTNLVPQYVEYHQMLGFAKHGRNLLNEVVKDHIELNKLVTPIYFAEQKGKKG